MWSVQCIAGSSPTFPHGFVCGQDIMTYKTIWPDGGPIEDGRGDSISPETLVLGEANLTLETLDP